jgi:hypothetical protein
MSSSDYDGAPGFGGPIRVLVDEHGSPYRAGCRICHAQWDLRVLHADELGRVLGPASCPNRCGEEAGEQLTLSDETTTPGTSRRPAGFRPVDELRID